MLSVSNVLLVKGIIQKRAGSYSTSKRWRFSYIVVAAYPFLLAKLKLSCLCAFLLYFKGNKY